MRKRLSDFCINALAYLIVILIGIACFAVLVGLVALTVNFCIWCFGG